MANPVQYAEDVLGVHTVWKEAQTREADHNKAILERVTVLQSLRGLRRRITDRETELTAEAPAKWPDANSTERGRLLKVDLHKDAILQDLRAEEDDLQATMDMLDGEVSRHEKSLRVLAARMEQLGGLLNFYASARSKSNESTSGRTE